MRRIILAFLLLSISSSSTLRSQSASGARKSQLPNFDIREGAQRPEALVQRRMANLASFAASPDQLKLGTRVVPNKYGLPKLYLREGRSLSAPSAGKPADIAKTFLRTQPEIFSLSSADVDRLRLLVEDVAQDAKFLTFNQTLGGIDVFNAQIKFTLNKDGEIIQVATGDVVPGLNISTVPRLTAAQAVSAAFAAIATEAPAALTSVAQANGKPAFLNPRGAGYSPITAELSIFPMTASSARLAYRIFIEADPRSWYEILVDAETGALLFRHNLYKFAAQGNVWTESPLKGSRTLFTFPAAWLPATGAVTTGNNADVYLDANGDDEPDASSDPNLRNGRAYSATQTFDFPFGDGTVQQDPRLYPASSVTNLFYFINIAHDYYYNLGFNEAAGNFQTNNFNAGGEGNDPVIAEAQWGLFEIVAGFAPTPEGTPPKMRVSLLDRNTASRTDDLDAAYDGPVVIHEYGHGVTTRLVGGKTSTSCLDQIQSAALGEGWSDYFSSSFFNNPVQGAYIGQNSTRGVRRYSYEGYPLTYEDLGNGSFGYQEHDDGEIWAATLWDLRKSLGATTTDRLVVNGLKATPCNPSMTDARDAILAADQAANNGANRAAIWTVFARHGLGYSAVGVDGTLLTGTRYDAAYDLPTDLQTSRNPAITSNPLLLRTGVGETYVYNIAASNPETGVLNYLLSSGPSNMTVNSSSGALRWTAAFVSPRVKVTVTDGKGGKVVHGFALPVFTALSDGQVVTIAGNIDTSGYASITVPAGVSVLQIKLRGGSGDADLYVTEPDDDFAVSFHDGSTETLSFANPEPGEWEIEVFGFTSYSGVSLAASFIIPTPISANSTLSGLRGDFTSETFYRIPIPPGVSTLTVATSGGTGDVDLFLRRDFPPTCQPPESVIADCLADRSATKFGNTESIIVTSPPAGNWYLDLVAYEEYTGVNLDITATFPPLTLATTGAATISTPGTSAALATGYATANIDSGTAPYGIAVFSLSQNGHIVSEAGVPASPPLQSARIFVEYRTGVAAGVGTIDILTGLAIANRGTSSASLTYSLRDRNGQIVATGNGTLPTGAHRAKFLHQLQDIAPNFAIPSNFPTNTLYGSLEITSTQPISILGMRLTTNQRGETLLTSTAIADLSRPATNAPLYFPQLADGGGYTTTIVLSNTTGSTQAGTISILDDDGNALSVRPVGGTVNSIFSYTIPPSGTFVFQTDGSPATLRAGWARVIPNSGSMAPVGAGVFSFSPAGILVTESGIPSAAATSRARLYVDKSKGHDTGLAIGNPGGSPITVTMQAFQTNGSGAASGPITLTIPANGHTAAFIGQLIGGLPGGFTGIADLTSNSEFVPLTLRSLTNTRGDFLLTTFPAPDINQPAPTPIVFPQIADGAGYTTQFIFISATGSASVSVNFISDDGLPLTIGRIP